MKKLLLIALAIISFSFQSSNKTTSVDFSNTFKIIVSLEDRNGNTVPVDTLHGYYAYNMETGVYYYDEYPYNIAVISNLPAGMYRVGARDGHFDGASSKVITISPNGEKTIRVTLAYWEE